jgi:uncharacterized membrane protein
MVSAFCYFPILAMVFLLIAPYKQDQTIRFHAWQCIGLVAALSLLQIALVIVGIGLQAMAPRLVEPLEIVSALILVCGLILFPIAGVMAYRQIRLHIPVVATLAERLA